MWVIKDNSSRLPKYLVKVAYNNAYWNMFIKKALRFDNIVRARDFFDKHVRYYVKDTSKIIFEEVK